MFNEAMNVRKIPKVLIYELGLILYQIVVSIIMGASINGSTADITLVMIYLFDAMLAVGIQEYFNRWDRSMETLEILPFKRGYVYKVRNCSYYLSVGISIVMSMCIFVFFAGISRGIIIWLLYNITLLLVAWCLAKENDGSKYDSTKMGLEIVFVIVVELIALITSVVIMHY